MESCKKLLDNSSMYFPTFSELNDPFEAAADYDTNNSEKEWIDFFEMMGVSPKEQSVLLSKLRNNPIMGGDIIRECIASSYNGNGCLSLTESADNILMWTHYADEGRGVCVGFDITEDPCFFLFPQKVNYDNEVVTLNYLKERNKIMEPLYHKNLKWEYEKEYRVIKVGFKGLRPFAKESLCSITFGYRVTESEINEIKKMVKTLGYPNVAFRKTVVDPHFPTLKIVNI